MILVALREPTWMKEIGPGGKPVHRYHKYKSGNKNCLIIQGQHSHQRSCFAITIPKAKAIKRPHACRGRSGGGGGGGILREFLVYCGWLHL